MKLSVIIANHNYADYVGAAISSALAVDWPDKEVLVVDDASTDASREIINAFGGKVAAYFRPKSNQLGAHTFGFERSTGDVIIFLDADDMLEPPVMQEVAKVWRPGVAKVQYRMHLIDAAGAQLGSAIPQFPPGESSRAPSPKLSAHDGLYDPTWVRQCLLSGFCARGARLRRNDTAVGRHIFDTRPASGRRLDHKKGAGPLSGA